VLSKVSGCDVEPEAKEQRRSKAWLIMFEVLMLIV